MLRDMGSSGAGRITIRTSIALDGALLAEVKRIAAQQRRATSAVIEDCLRSGLIDGSSGHPSHHRQEGGREAESTLVLRADGAADGVVVVDSGAVRVSGSERPLTGKRR